LTDIVQDGKLLAAALEAKKHHVHLEVERWRPSMPRAP